MPRGLVVILASTGLLVTTLALQQFSSVLSPVLLALVLVVGVHPLTGLLRRRGAPEWLAITCTLLVLVAIIPLAVLWGLLAFVTNYIPNVGFLIGLVPPALLALLEGGPELMISVIVAYSVINFVLQSVIQPKFVGDAVNLSLTLTFLSLLFWSFVIGPLGAVLAIPLTLLAKALLLDVDPDTRWISRLFASGSADQPPAVRPYRPSATPAADGQATGPGAGERR